MQHPARRWTWRAACAGALALALVVWSAAAQVGEMNRIRNIPVTRAQAERFWSRLEARYQAIRPQLGQTQVVVGYFPVYQRNDLPGLTRRTMAQYALASVTIDFENEHPLAIADFHDDAHLRQFLAGGSWVVKAHPEPGLAVLERREAAR